MEHIVEFEKYCRKCEHFEEDGVTCDDCLGTPGREDSKKPINFKRNEKWKPTDMFDKAYDEITKEK